MKYFVNIALFCCVCVVLVLSSKELARTVRYVDLTYVSENFGSNSSRISRILHDYGVKAETIVSDDECRSDILRAGTGIVLADLDRINPDIDYPQWEEAAKRAERLLAHALNCAPMVSDYWLRYAMVRRAAGEVPSEQATFMKRAVDLDPASAAGLRARFALWTKLSDQSLAAAAPSLKEDLYTLLRYSSPQFVREVLKGARKPLVVYITSTYATLPQDRLDRLNRWRVLPKPAL